MKGFRLDRPADRWCLGCGLVLVLSLLLSDTVLRAYVALTDAHPFAAGFCKFALLATFGESLAQRMQVGRYLPPRFGLVPRALAWGVLGICIIRDRAAAFTTNIIRTNSASTSDNRP